MSEISLSILHTPWVPARVKCLGEMLYDLLGKSGHPRWWHIFDDKMPEGGDWHQFKTTLAIAQWEWSLKTTATHHLFLTDDLNIHPSFWLILQAMIEAKPEAIMGLMSNSPQAADFAMRGVRWYRCNSWVVGPAYLVPRKHLEPFLAWYKELPDTDKAGCRRWYNDDSALNGWNMQRGPHMSWHPVPTIIEHRKDIDSTVGHGDRFSRERVSWRSMHSIHFTGGGDFKWETVPFKPIFSAHMSEARYWDADGPMIGLGGEEP